MQHERWIDAAQLSVGSEGWTTLDASPRGRTHDACASDDAQCCVRHPRACSRRRDGSKQREEKKRSRSDSKRMILRDDLFLDDMRDAHSEQVHGGVRSYAPSAPRVVRAHRDCESHPGLVANAVQQERNASRAARRVLAASPLPVVAVLFFGTHYERLPLLQAVYERYFQRIVFMSPKAEIAGALQRSSSSQSSSAGPRASAHPHHCRHGLKLTYACVAQIAQTHGLSSPHLRGLLFFHFDLWIQPWRLFDDAAAVDSASSSPSLLSRIWALPHGRIMLKASGPTRLLPLECFNVSTPSQYRMPYPAWTWDRDLPPAYAGLRKACGAKAGGRAERTGGLRSYTGGRLAHGAVGGLRTVGATTGEQNTSPCAQPDRLCIGWADLYYVPRRHFVGFAQLASQFASTGSNAELAVPTMLQMLSETPSSDAEGATVRAKAKPSAAETVHRPPCWGYCCSSTGCPELLARYPCGHRMQLAEMRVRTALQDLLRADD